MTRSIQADWKIRRVLDEYPELLETIISLSPAFAKLRNPVLRKVQTRLVTVEQAARIAGIDPGEMLAALNGERDTSVAVPAAQPSASAPLQVPDRVHTVLDVRPLLDRGEEPFSHIMAAARPIPVGDTLHLVSSFEPVPLYDALAGVGFETRSHAVTADEWHVYATRLRLPGVPKVPSDAAAVSTGATYAEVTIDVSELVPPEPMMKILEALNTLAPGGSLRVHHVRRPVYLYDRLDSMGYEHVSTDLADGKVEILIHKPEQDS